MLSSILISVAIAAQSVLGTPIRARSPYSIKETHNAPRKWIVVDRAPASHMLHLQIGLKQERFEELEKHLYEVSNPNHARYGQHLSHEEVQDLVRPSENNLDLVHEWLLTNGVDKLDYSPAKDWINLYISVDSAERLLDTEYSVYEHEDGSQVVRTSKWSLPDHLHDVIDTIQPTTSFFKTKPQSTDFVQFPQPYVPPNYQPPSNATIAKVCNVSSVTIECFQTLYGTLGYEQKVVGSNKIAFNNYLGQTPIRPDVYKFLQKYRPEAADEAFSFQSVEIAGGPAAQVEPLTPEQSHQDDFSREALLDVQTIIGMTYPAPVVSYSTGGSPPFNPDLNTPTDTNEPYLVWVNWVSKQADIPQVISSSYGDDEQSVPKGYARRVCHEFAQLGARGVSLLVSSGDGGVGGSDPAACVTNDGKNTTTFLPAFPASCPYVTAVGATMHFEPEVSAYRESSRGLYASGSGFSSYFHRPKYQDDVVPAYVKSLSGKWEGLFDKSGRGYPDVSAQGLAFAFMFNQTEGTISGTSASCPLMSSIISLVNDALISSGKPPLGFLNPWLYAKGYQGFTDVVSGDSHGCGGTGFPTAVGWDPVTGFGTPIFPALVDLAKN